MKHQIPISQPSGSRFYLLSQLLDVLHSSYIFTTCAMPTSRNFSTLLIYFCHLRYLQHLM